MEPLQDEHSPTAEEQWRMILMGADPGLARRRWLRKQIPSAPRCKMCAAPFSGIGGPIMSLFGHAPWPKNPKYCTGCFRGLQRRHGGAEIECSLLFADVRGSTSLAEQLPPAEFRRQMGRFFDAASQVLFDHDAIVDKFVGDEVIGIFVPAFAGAGHARSALTAAKKLLLVTGHDSKDGPWVPVGVGVNTGVAFIGSVGEGMDAELTAMGDVVNVTARLASEAAAGEILLTASTASASGVALGSAERRSLQLKGKSEPTEVFVLYGAVNTGARSQ
jgi:adenylate cyclase